MLHSVDFYYQKSIDSGVKSMDCPINTYLRNPISGEIQHWPEVKTYKDYIGKCYSIAKEVPLEELYREYYEAKFHSRQALERIHLKVIDALNSLNKKDLNHHMGYTPISHVREQLINLSCTIEHTIRCGYPVASKSSYKPVVTVSKRNIFAWIFG